MVSSRGRHRSAVRDVASRYLPVGSLRRSLASGAFWSLVGAVSSRGLMLLTTIVLARLLGKSGYGLWGLVASTVSMFAGLAGAGLSVTATKHIAQLKKTDPARAGRTLSLVMAVGLVSVMLMAVLCMVTSGWVSNRLYHTPSLSGPLKLAGLMVFFMVAAQILQGALAGFEEFQRIAYNNLVQGIVAVMVAIPMTYWLGVPGAVIGMAIAWAAAMMLNLRETLRASRKHGLAIGARGMWQERHVLWSYIAPSLLTSVVAAPAPVLGLSLVMQTEGGLAGIGGLTVALRWRDLVLFIPASIKRVALPMLSRLRGENDGARFVRALWANIGLNGGVALAGAIPVALLAPWILSLYGPEFRQDWDLIAVLMVAAVFQAVNDVVTQVTACTNRMWWRFFIHIVWAGTLVGGSYWLVPVYGVRGYAWALTLAVVGHMLLNITAAIVSIRGSDGIEAAAV
ncbi:MAG: oligosaccharide flippase family protein [Phycisphaerae bacterium]